MPTDEDILYIDIDEFVTKDELKQYATLEDVKRLLDDHAANDQQQFDALIAALENIAASNQPISKGALREFAEFILSIPGLSQMISNFLFHLIVG